MITAEQLASGILTAYALHSQGKYSQAEAVADCLLILDPNNSYLHSLAASSCQLQKKFEKALSEYTKAIELQPKDAASLLNRGEIYLKLGKFSEAYQDLKETSYLDPTSQNAFSNRARLLLELTSSALKAASDQPHL